MVLKSQYEIIMEEQTAAGQVKVYSDKESNQILAQLATSDEILWEYQKKIFASEQELKNIFLD